jgi:hypothetical protein
MKQLDVNDWIKKPHQQTNIQDLGTKLSNILDFEPLGPLQ